MQHGDDKLASAISSRICHDLISPIGAVSNGLELLEMAGLPPGPEIELVNQSAHHASARVRYFRLAFGATKGYRGADANDIANSEVKAILAAVFDGSRIVVTWQARDDLPRPLAKALLLAVMCAETALPVGGTIEVTQNGPDWLIAARGAKIKTLPELWGILQGDQAPADIAPAAVQFVLLPGAVTRIGRGLSLTITEDGLQISL